MPKTRHCSEYAEGRKQRKSVSTIFLSAVVFSVYLMLTLPVSSAQSLATINVTFLGPDSSTRLAPPEPVSIRVPSGLINKQINVEDKSPTKDWTDVKAAIKVSSIQGFLITDGFLMPCADEKFKLQDPTDCIQNFQKNQKR